MKFCFALLSVTAAALTAAQASPNDLIGTYDGRDKSGWHPLVRIERQGGAYKVFTIAQGGTWVEGKTDMVPVTGDQYAKITRRQSADQFEGLANKGLAVFKVQPGWTSGKFVASTGYFMYFALGAVELRKQ